MKELSTPATDAEIARNQGKVFSVSSSFSRELELLTYAALEAWEEQFGVRACDCDTTGGEPDGDKHVCCWCKIRSLREVGHE